MVVVSLPKKKSVSKNYLTVKKKQLRKNSYFSLSRFFIKNYCKLLGKHYTFKTIWFFELEFKSLSNISESYSKIARLILDVRHGFY